MPGQDSLSKILKSNSLSNGVWPWALFSLGCLACLLPFPWAVAWALLAVCGIGCMFLRVGWPLLALITIAIGEANVLLVPPARIPFVRLEAWHWLGLCLFVSKLNKQVPYRVVGLHFFWPFLVWVLFCTCINWIWIGEMQLKEALFLLQRFFLLALVFPLLRVLKEERNTFETVLAYALLVIAGEQIGGILHVLPKAWTAIRVPLQGLATGQGYRVVVVFTPIFVGGVVLGLSVIEKPKQMLHWLGLLACTLILLLSGSRSGLTFGIALLIVPLWSAWPLLLNVQRLVVFGFSLVAALMLAIGPTAYAIKRLWVVNLDNEASFFDRKREGNVVLALIGEHPWVGFGLSRVLKQFKNMDVGVLNLVLAVGWPGWFFLMACMFLWFRAQKIEKLKASQRHLLLCLVAILLPSLLSHSYLLSSTPYMVLTVWIAASASVLSKGSFY